MDIEQGFEEWFEENENEETGQEDTNRDEYDWEGRIHDMCKMAWVAGNNHVEAPAIFINQEDVEAKCNELIGKLVAACGCQHKSQMNKVGLKLLAVATSFVEYSTEAPAVRLVDTSGKTIN